MGPLMWHAFNFLVVKCCGQTASVERSVDLRITDRRIGKRSPCCFEDDRGTCVAQLPQLGVKPLENLLIRLQKTSAERSQGLTEFGQFEAISRDATEIRENFGRGFGRASLGGEKHVHRLGA